MQSLAEKTQKPQWEFQILVIRVHMQGTIPQHNKGNESCITCKVTEH